jgi:hypothetical protein
MQFCPPSDRKRESEIPLSKKYPCRSPKRRHISTSASALCQNTEVWHRMKRLIFADVSPKPFRYLAAALVLSAVFTLVSSSSLRNPRQYGAGLSFIVTFCYIVWLLTQLIRRETESGDQLSVRNCARPFPKLQSASRLVVIDSTRSPFAFARLLLLRSFSWCS